jgi:hypothetical protein
MLNRYRIGPTAPGGGIENPLVYVWFLDVIQHICDVLEHLCQERQYRENPRKSQPSSWQSPLHITSSIILAREQGKLTMV